MNRPTHGLLRHARRLTHDKRLDELEQGLLGFAEQNVVGASADIFGTCRIVGTVNDYLAPLARATSIIPKAISRMRLRHILERN